MFFCLDLQFPAHKCPSLWLSCKSLMIISTSTACACNQHTISFSVMFLRAEIFVFDSIPIMFDDVSSSMNYLTSQSAAAERIAWYEGRWIILSLFVCFKLFFACEYNSSMCEMTSSESFKSKLKKLQIQRQLHITSAVNIFLFLKLIIGNVCGWMIQGQD